MYKFVSIGDLRVRIDQIVSYQYFSIKMPDKDGQEVWNNGVEIYYSGRFAQMHYKTPEEARIAFERIDWEFAKDKR